MLKFSRDIVLTIEKMYLLESPGPAKTTDVIKLNITPTIQWNKWSSILCD